ncbi:MAG: molybdopterin-dependent oxidoreductase [Thermoanaerobacteraceae bacterium]|nr:molybdopterin-dependent oxidoreductase [Thermoanaerobacteraceae bacterium]
MPASPGRGRYSVYRHACPRNCYDACGMLSHVERGVLQKVSGDPQHGFSRGRLCPKAYSYVQQVYSPDRLKYPLRQHPRGSGHWERITWEEALEQVAAKILELKDRYGSTLPVALNKYSGNFGLLHYAVEGFFTSLGPTTRAAGSPCWSAGLDACFYDFGAFHCPDPEDLVYSRLVILWGANPVWNSLHSWYFIQQARERGALVVCVDPVITATASRADLYLRVIPGTDGALALGAIRCLLEENLLDETFLNRHTRGWPRLREYILERVTVEWAARETGLSPEKIRDLARLYATRRPAALWVGFGLQRYRHGGQTVRAINALAAAAGQLGRRGGGVYYAHLDTWQFNFYAREPGCGPDGAGNISGDPVLDRAAFPNPVNGSGNTLSPGRARDRLISINRFWPGILAAQDPPVKMLWVACRNPLSQDAHCLMARQVLEKMELVVVADLFLTATARAADLVLPVTTPFEEWDLVMSYWHRWVALNEQAIAPVGEARSDLSIAVALARTLNRLAPGSSTFPPVEDAAWWLDREMNDTMRHMLGIRDWRELRQGPRKAALPVPWADGVFATPSGKMELYSRRAAEDGLPPMALYVSPAAPPSGCSYRLLTPHFQHGLNSQFAPGGWLQKLYPEPALVVHPRLAREKGLGEGDRVRVYNDQGELTLPVQILPLVPEGVVLCYQGANGTDLCINTLVKPVETDMGRRVMGAPGAAFFETFVNLEPAAENETGKSF